MLRFTDIDQVPRGTLSRLLHETYAPLLAEDPTRWKPQCTSWDAFDDEAYSRETVGRCVFISWCDDAVVGFGSFDPRDIPTVGRVGHHCVVPAFRGRSLGAAQLDEIVRRLCERGATTIEAITLDLPFFAPARKRYQAAGFVLIERTTWPAHPAIARLRYRKPLSASATAIGV